MLASRKRSLDFQNGGAFLSGRTAETEEPLTLARCRCGSKLSENLDVVELLNFSPGLSFVLASALASWHIS